MYPTWDQGIGQPKIEVFMYEIHPWKYVQTYMNTQKSPK